MSYKGKTVVGIVPARGGSKKVYKKNIKLIAGKPLLAWTIDCALNTTIIDHLIVSTDDREIVQVAEEFGASVPFLRPQHLATDTTPDLPVCSHAIHWLEKEKNIKADIIVWLRPTSPLRTPQDIEDAIALLFETEADGVRSITQVDHHPYWMKKLSGKIIEPFLEDANEKIYYQRQMLPPLYRLNGAVDITKYENISREIMYGERIAGLVMPQERSIDLDTELDFELTEILLRRRIQNEQNTDR